MNVKETIEKRRSVREFTDQIIDGAVLKEVLDAGRLAPSASNRQRWKFIVVEDQELKDALVAACANQNFVAKGQAIIVVCGDQGKTMRCGQSINTIDCSIALSFMMLEAWELGLGMCWIGAFYEDQVRKILDIPQEYEIVALSPIGYPAKEIPAHNRLAIDEVVVKNQWE
ncbi:MAG: nitroreductase family protein [Erysipelotrichaceae bacterium]